VAGLGIVWLSQLDNRSCDFPARSGGGRRCLCGYGRHTPTPTNARRQSFALAPARSLRSRSSANRWIRHRPIFETLPPGEARPWHGQNEVSPTVWGGADPTTWNPDAVTDSALAERVPERTYADGAPPSPTHRKSIPGIHSEDHNCESYDALVKLDFKACRYLASVVTSSRFPVGSTQTCYSSLRSSDSARSWLAARPHLRQPRQRPAPRRPAPQRPQRRNPMLFNCTVVSSSSGGSMSL